MPFKSSSATLQQFARATSLAAAFLFVACASRGPAAIEPVPDPCEGFSGMAPIDASSYLGVNDSKSAKPVPRLTRIVVGEDGYQCSPVAVADWRDADGPADDLESACALPGRPGEFLVSESGIWNGKYGRLFHIRLNGNSAEVVSTFKLQVLVPSSKGQDGDNYEGMACLARNDGTYLVLLGERGGSSTYPSGSLRTGVFDARTQSLQWAPKAVAGIDIAAPGAWPAGMRHRDISDLYVDREGTIWVAASADAGDNGPFRSVVFAAGQVTDDAARPFDLSTPSRITLVDGLKIEALSAAPASIPGAALSIGTDDENYAGVWRPLFTQSPGH